MPLLFSYGTLRDVSVQRELFGRNLQGRPDELVGFELSSVQVREESHAIVRVNGESDSRVHGTVFEISDAELAAADAYEPAEYTRISARLASGREAWVYAAWR